MSLVSAVRAGDGIPRPAACLPWSDKPGGGRTRVSLLGCHDRLLSSRREA